MYFTVQVTRKNNETAKNIFSFDTLKDALSNHFYFLSSSYADPDVVYILGMIIDNRGNVVERNLYGE